MQVIPALDIMGGRVVRLTRGDPETSKLYGSMSPLEAAERWSREGAELIHIVDIDAALRKGSNRDQILEIVESLAVKVQVGGGIRDMQEAASLLDAGVYRVVLGSYALGNQSEAARLLDAYGPERVSVALDHRDGRVLIKGWTETTKKSLVETLQEYTSLGFTWFLATDADRDGALAGPDVETYREISKQASIIASGGVSKLEDLVALREAGASAAVIGKALYEGRFTYREAVNAGEGL
jgi:phosphoribosylformimino-5-aminoimidazole carboxamide ribotide isomerase